LGRAFQQTLDSAFEAFAVGLSDIDELEGEPGILEHPDGLALDRDSAFTGQVEVQGDASTDLELAGRLNA